MNMRQRILISLPYLMALGVGIWFYLVYPGLPATVPLHWDSTGTPNQFASRSSLLYLLLLTVFIPVLMDILPYIDPRRANYRDFAESYQKMKLGIAGFMAFMFLLSVSTAMTPDQKLSTRMMSVGLGLLFMLIGNYLAKVKTNFFVGIKTPWTLSSDEVWRRTHRLGGWLFFLAGLITMVAGQLTTGQNLFPISIGVIMFAAIVPIVYSYFIYRHLT